MLWLERIFLCLLYKGTNSYLFVNGTEVIKYKANDSEIYAIALYLGNIWNNCSVDNMKKTGFYGYVYDFSVDYDAIAVHDILDIPKCLMKKNNIVQIKCLGLLKKFCCGNDTFWLQYVKMCFNE